MKQSNKYTKTLVILDAHAIIHRAYHALPSFTTSDGEPTGALYGVITMTLKILETFKPDAIVAAFDLPKPTFRHAAYDGYKGTRVKTEDALVTQLQTARDLFEAFGIPVLDAEGFEADDVVGTLAAAHKKDPSVRIIVASGDMDTMQLVDGDQVQVFTLKKGINDTILYNEDAVRDRYGFEPSQLIDYKGLRGDPSDNIIGVPGIGEKTATGIIATYGSIEALYKDLDAGDTSRAKSAGLTPRLVQVLTDHRDDAFFSKTLATIRTDAPVSFTMPAVSYMEHAPLESIMTFCDRYEFRSLKARITAVLATEHNSAPVEEVPTVDTAPVDPLFEREVAIALWVLYSEHTNATAELILQKTKAKNLTDAYQIILEELRKRNSLEVFEQIEKPLMPVIVGMEQNGIALDVPYLNALITELDERIKTIEKEAAQYSGGSVNLNSPKQLSTLLFDTLGLKPKGKRKESGAFTTNAEALEGLRDAHPFVPLLLEHRELQKIASTYGVALRDHVQADGRIHATFLQHGTTTGRFSSQDPNMQNIPAGGEWGKKIRHAFVAPKGSVFIGCDYSQIELRVLAMLSQDPTLVSTFEQGADIHTKVAAEVFDVAPEDVTADMRRSAKVINFGIIYGMGVQALQKNLMTTKERAQTFYDEYFAAFPTIRAYLESVKDSARTLGYTQTLFGRRRYFPTIAQGPSYLRAFAERMATNAPIQGTAADIIKLAILSIDVALKESGLSEKVRLVLQVHDEVVYEVDAAIQDEAKSCITGAMVGVLKRYTPTVPYTPVPLAVSCAVGERLDELK